LTVLLDAFALIALLRDEPAADEVETILRRGEAAMSAVNLAEALDVLQRVDGVDRARLDALTGPLIGESLALLAVDERTARDGADIRARRYHRTRAPLSLADCLLLAAARGAQAVVATADRPLASAARAEEIEVAALPDSRGRRP
jgi:PIN domain nuclease of toxin-antitoxin system